MFAVVERVAVLVRRCDARWLLVWSLLFLGWLFPGVGSAATGAFTTLPGSMTTMRVGAAAAPLPNGVVLIAGGADALGNVLSSAEVFDPSTGKCRSGACTRAAFQRSMVWGFSPRVGWM